MVPGHRPVNLYEYTLIPVTLTYVIPVQKHRAPGGAGIGTLRAGSGTTAPGRAHSHTRDEHTLTYWTSIKRTGLFDGGGGGGADDATAANETAVYRLARAVACDRAGVSLGLVGCEVRLCDPCARVPPCVPVPAPPGVFLGTGIM